MVSSETTDLTPSAPRLAPHHIVEWLLPREAFAKLDPRELDAVAALCETVVVRPEAEVVRVGERWDALYIVTTGEMRLHYPQTKGAALAPVTLGSGAVFGEACLFSDAPADCTARGGASRTTLVRIPVDRLTALRHQSLTIDSKLEIYARRRTLAVFLARTSPASPPTAKQIDDVVVALGQRQLQAGEVVEETAGASALYLVTAGRLHVSPSGAGAPGAWGARRGDVIGGLGTALASHSLGRVVADTDATLVVVPRAALEPLLAHPPQVAASSEPVTPAVLPPAPGKVSATNRLQRFFTYVRPHARLLGEIALASFVIQIFSIFLPLFIRFIVDDVIIKQDGWWLIYGLLGISVVILLHFVLSYCRQQLLLLVSTKAASQLTSDFYTQVLSLPMPFFIKNKVGEITSRFEENQKVTDFLSDIGPQLFFSLFTVALYLTLMSYFNGALTLVTLGFVALHIVIMGAVSPLLQRAYKDSFEKGAASESYLIECFRGLSTIKMLAIERRTRWTWENLYVRFSNAYFKSLTYSMSANLASGFVANSSEVGVLFYGGVMVLRDQMTVGELTAFIFLIQGVTAPLIKLVMFWATFQETLNAADRLNEVFNEPPELSPEVARTRTVVPPLRGDVRLEEVNFRYEVESQAMFLQDIRLDVRRGQRIAFVGRSGSGKSTLLKLLLGFYPPLSGRIVIDGYDLQEAWLPSVREQIGIIPQMTQLFEGTIQENIALAKPGAPLAEIMDAARLAMAHEFITALPQGYGTRVEVSGANLSGGQRQRLAIARALLHDPRMLILDEATSALDNETERLVMNNLEARFKDRTIFMTAHRLSTVRHADLIVVLDRGRILEQGSHDQLLTRKGMYYFLHAQQTEM